MSKDVDWESFFDCMWLGMLGVILLPLTVTKGERCDWCNGEMKFAGANFRRDVKRACGFHLNTAKSYLRKQREEYGLPNKDSTQ